MTMTPTDIILFSAIGQLLALGLYWLARFVVWLWSFLTSMRADMNEVAISRRRRWLESELQRCGDR